jgi:putative tryptophan/tyrosine transport system substrate-binding protein
MIGRREFITLLGGAAAWPLAARAQQLSLPTIGFLGANTPETQSRWTSTFVKRLGELGWTDGRNAVIDYRWADGRRDRAAEIATEFVRLGVTIIVTSGTPQALAAKQATSTIPIVFATSGDPVGTGLVASLARPGGNVTGLSVLQVDLGAKRLELLREIIPGLRRLAVVVNIDAPGALLELSEVQRAAGTLGIEIIAVRIRRIDEIAAAFDQIRGRVDAVHVASDPLLFVHRARTNTLALGLRLPTLHNFREHVEAGGLMSYGPDYAANFRRAAGYTDKILRGAKPGELPVEQPTRVELVISLITAKALSIEVPPSLLARADEVIE